MSNDLKGLEQILAGLAIKGAVHDPSELPAGDRSGWLAVTDSFGSLNAFFSGAPGGIVSADQVYFDPTGLSIYESSDITVRDALARLDAPNLLLKSANNLGDLTDPFTAWNNIMQVAGQSVPGVVRLATYAELNGAAWTGVAPVVHATDLSTNYLRKNKEDIISQNIVLTASPVLDTHIVNRGQVNALIAAAIGGASTSLGYLNQVTIVDNNADVTGNGQVGNILAPFTGATALADAFNAVINDIPKGQRGLIVVTPSATPYLCADNLLADNVDWFFMPGTTVRYTGSAALFADGGLSARNAEIRGYGNFEALTNGTILRLVNAASKVVFEANAVSITSTSGDVARVLNISGCATLDVTINEITSVNSTSFLLATSNSSAAISINVKRIFSASLGSVLTTSGTGGTYRLTFEDIKHVSNSPAITLNDTNTILYIKGGVITLTNSTNDNAVIYTSTGASGHVYIAVDKAIFSGTARGSVLAYFANGGMTINNCQLENQNNSIYSYAVVTTVGSSAGLTIKNSELTVNNASTYSISGDSTNPIQFLGYIKINKPIAPAVITQGGFIEL